MAKPNRVNAAVTTPAGSVAGMTPDEILAAYPGATPTEVTDAWDGLRTVFGAAAPYNLNQGRAVVRGFKNAVR